MAQVWTRTETVAASQVTGTLTNYPALVSRTHNDFRTTGHGGHVAHANGYDLCLYADAGLTTLLKQETVRYVASTGEVIKWVKVPSLATGTVIYWGYGDTGISASQDDATNVWDSNYKAVWHLSNGTTLTTTDSTSHALNGTAGSGMTVDAGYIGGGASFDATSNGYMSTANNTLGATTLTVECWAYSTNFAHNGVLVQKEVVNAQWMFFFETTLKLRGGGTSNTLSVSAPSNSTWHHLCATISGTTGIIYKDGDGGTSGTVNAATDTSNTIQLGRYSGSGTGYYFNGKMDEVRVSNIARSADWIAACYKNQSAPTTFWTLGAESAAGAGVVGRSVQVRQAVARAATF